MRDEPKQPHYKAIYDAYVATGRTDVSDLIEETLKKVSTARLMFPDLYVHEVTAALIKAGIIPAGEATADEAKYASERWENQTDPGAPNWEART